MVSKEWEYTNRKLSKGKGKRHDAPTWTGQLMRDRWRCSIGQWSARNINERGDKYAVSLSEKEFTLERKEIMYIDAKPIAREKQIDLKKTV